MKEDKWIHDIQADELINLKDVHSVYVYRDQNENDNCVAEYTLLFLYYGKTSSIYLHYDSSELLHNAFEHYTHILGCKELDVSRKPLKL